MKLKAGDPVMIDLEMAETGSTGIFRCCGRRYDQDDLHRLLRSVAEGEWRVAKQQSDVSTCGYCGRSAPRPQDEISLEASSPFRVGGIESRYWSTPRSWLRLAALPEGWVRE